MLVLLCIGFFLTIVSVDKAIMMVFNTREGKELEALDKEQAKIGPLMRSAPKLMLAPYRGESSSPPLLTPDKVEKEVSLNERVMRLQPLLFDKAHDWSAMYMYTDRDGVGINVKIKGIDIKSKGKDFELAITDLEQKMVIALEKQAIAIDADLAKIKAAHKLLKA